MPRKKSVKGRSRGVDAVSRVMLEAEKINRRFRQLEEHGRYGTYKSKELLEFISRNRNLTVVKSKSTGRHRIVIKKVNIKDQDLMLIDKKFKSFLRSKASTPMGIDKIEKKIREKIEKTLQEDYGGELTDEDIETFYEILRYRNNEIVQQIEPSEFYNLVLTAREDNWKKRKWVDVLSKYADNNNKEMQKKARKLYTKLVK